MEKTHEQCCLDCRNLQKTWDGVWWDKNSSSGSIINKWRVKISQKRLYNVRDPSGIGRGFIWELKRKYCSIKNWNCIQVWKEYNQELPSSDFDRGRISLQKACLSLSSYHLFHYESCLSHWNLVFNPLSTNSLHWALWTWIHLPFGLRIQNLPLQIS